MAETKSVTMTKDRIKQAIAQAALAQLGIDPATPGLQVSTRLSEMVDVLTNADCSATVRVTTPDS